MDENEKQEEEIVEIDVTETSTNGELKTEMKGIFPYLVWKN